MPFYIHDGAAWRLAKEVHVHDGAAWRRAREVHVRDGAAWRLGYVGLRAALSNKDLYADHTAFGQGVSGLAYSGVTLHSSGAFECYAIEGSGRTSQWPAGEWLQVGSASQYEVIAWHQSGTAPSGAALGAWHNLGTSREWYVSSVNSGAFAATVSGQIRIQIRPAGGGPILADAVFNLNATAAAEYM